MVCSVIVKGVQLEFLVIAEETSRCDPKSDAGGQTGAEQKKG